MPREKALSDSVSIKQICDNNIDKYLQDFIYIYIYKDNIFRASLLLSIIINNVTIREPTHH